MAAHRGQDAAFVREVVHQGARSSLSGKTRYYPYELPRRLSIRDIQLLSAFSVCELDLNDLREINVWQFDNEKFGLGQPMEIEYSIMKLETE